jgi:hypothetical protein
MWIPRTGGILTCGFQEQGEHVDSITGGTWRFQEQGEHVDSKNRGISNMWIQRRGTKMWIVRTGGILTCGFQEQGEF